MNNPIILEKNQWVKIDTNSFKVDDLIFFKNVELLQNDILELIQLDLRGELYFNRFASYCSDIYFDFSFVLNLRLSEISLSFESLRQDAKLHLMSKEYL